MFANKFILFYLCFTQTWVCIFTDWMLILDTVLQRNSGVGGFRSRTYLFR